jgi:hypothetical protein
MVKNVLAKRACKTLGPMATSLLLQTAQHAQL